MTEPVNYLAYLSAVGKDDAEHLYEKEKKYGDSWKRRGGVGAFMMLARKWDRLENIVRDEYNWDIFAAMEAGALDDNDLGDLRRYAMLIEAEMRHRDEVENAATAV